jgi:hypothetical protein
MAYQTEGINSMTQTALPTTLPAGDGHPHQHD